MKILYSDVLDKMQENADKLKVGDTVKYEGLYADCQTPPIILGKQYTVLEIVDNQKIKIGDENNQHIVYKCELNIWPKLFTQ